MDERGLQEIVAGLPLEVKVGQIFMLGIDPALTPHQARSFLRKHHLGGAFLTRRNLPEVGAAVKLLAHLRGTDPILPPPFLAIDEEGGFVSNIDHLTTAAPCGLAQAVGGPETARACARAAGEKLRALGFNAVFAPVADVNDVAENPVIGIRSFGDDPGAVGMCVLAAVSGYRDAKVAPCLKHFPGHGHTALDSHLTLPTVTRAAEEMERTDLVPFKAGVRAGARLVMSAHVAYPGLGEDRPATWSPGILHDLLRVRIGFDGVLVTDAMEMKGAGGTFGESPAGRDAAGETRRRMGESAIRSLNAGADLLLYAFGGEEAVLVLHAVMRAAKRGEVLAARLDEAVTRVLSARASLAGPVIDESEREEILTRRHETTLRDAHERSIALLAGGLPELRAASGVPGTRGAAGRSASPRPKEARVIALHPVSVEPVRPLAMEAFVAAMRPVETIAIPFGFDPDPGEIARALEAAKTSVRPDDLVLVFTQSRGPINAGQGRLAEEACRAFGGRTIGVAAVSPHDAGAFPAGVAAIVATLGGEPPRLHALARVLRGELSPTPGLPIRVMTSQT